MRGCAGCAATLSPRRGAIGARSRNERRPFRMARDQRVNPNARLVAAVLAGASPDARHGHEESWDRERMSDHESVQCAVVRNSARCPLRRAARRRERAGAGGSGGARRARTADRAGLARQTGRRHRRTDARHRRPRVASAPELATGRRDEALAMVRSQVARLAGMVERGSVRLPPEVGVFDGLVEPLADQELGERLASRLPITCSPVLRWPALGSPVSVRGPAAAGLRTASRPLRSVRPACAARRFRRLPWNHLRMVGTRPRGALLDETPSPHRGRGTART